MAPICGAVFRPCHKSKGNGQLPSLQRKNVVPDAHRCCNNHPYAIAVDLASKETRTMRRRIVNLLALGTLVVLASGLALVPATLAQDRLKTMPGYDQYQKMSGATAGSVKMGQANASWLESGKAFEYSSDGKRYRYDIAT